MAAKRPAPTAKIRTTAEAIINTLLLFLRTVKPQAVNVFALNVGFITMRRRGVTNLLINVHRPKEKLKPFPLEKQQSGTLKRRAERHKIFIN